MLELVVFFGGKLLDSVSLPMKVIETVNERSTDAGQGVVSCSCSRLTEECLRASALSLC